MNFSKAVARLEWNESRGNCYRPLKIAPGFAMLNPGYCQPLFASAAGAGERHRPARNAATSTAP